MFISGLHAFIIHFKYLLLFFGVIVEGPIIMVASGFLIHQGIFELLPAFIAIFAGDLAGDVAWYYIGYYFAEPFLRKHGHFLSVTPEGLEKAKLLFKRYHVKILLISKMTLGFGMALATLIAAGATRVSFRLYMLLNALGEFILIALLLVAGYYFGYLYASIAKGFKNFFLIGLVAFVALLIYGFTKYMKKKITADKL